MNTPWRGALASQAAAAQVSWVGVRLMAGYRAIGDGADPAFLGLLASTFAIPALLAAIPAGRLSDRWGGSAITVMGLGVTSAALVMFITLPGLGFLLAAAAAYGLGNLLVMVGQQSFVAQVSAGGPSDSAFGTLTAAASIGQLIGPVAVTAVASLGAEGSVHPDTRAGFVVALCFTVIAAAAALGLRPANRALGSRRRASPRGPKPSTLSTLRTAGLWRSLAVSAAVLVTVDLMYAFVPVWATGQGIGVTSVGILLAVRAAVSVASRLGLSRLVARFGRKRLIAASLIAAIAGLIALPFVGFWGAVPVMIGLGLGLGIPQPLTMAWVVSLIPPREHGAALGLRLSANRLAQITLPLAVGVVAAPLGVIGIFWANAALLIGSLALLAGGREID